MRSHSESMKSTLWSTSRRETPPAADLPQELAQGRGLAVVQTGARLVEEQDLRLAVEGPGQLEEATLPVGEQGGGRRRQVGEADQVEHLHAPLPPALLMAPHDRAAQPGAR